MADLWCTFAPSEHIALLYLCRLGQTAGPTGRPQPRRFLLDATDKFKNRMDLARWTCTIEPVKKMAGSISCVQRTYMGYLNVFLP